MTSSTPASGAERRIYSRAPLFQATISIQVPPPSDRIAEAEQEMLRERFGEEYPKVVPVVQGQFQINFNPIGSTAASSATVIGLAFASADDKVVFRVLPGDCTFTRNAPYTQWEDVRESFAAVWLEYARINPVKRCQRIGLRYVNRFPFSEAITLSEYFRIAPNVSSDLPSGLNSFFMQTQFNYDDCALVINQGNGQAPDQPPFIVLDFDLFRTDISLEDTTEALTVLENMHEKLDRVFEASITDKTRELIS